MRFQKILQEPFLSIFNNRHFLPCPCVGLMLMYQWWFTVKTSC